MAVDDDLLDLAEQAAFNQVPEVLVGHPGQEALQPGPAVYFPPASGGTGVAGVAMSNTLVRSVQMKGRLRYSSL